MPTFLLPDRPALLRFASTSVLLVAGTLGFLLPMAKADVSREPPARYFEQLAPQLTPLAQVLAGGADLQSDNPSGIILLEERVQVVDAQGRRFDVCHTVYKSLTEPGAQALGESIFSYRHKEQAFHLVLAETIQPDGSVMPVKPNAVLLQSPQRQADYALYDDVAEVKVIYPNVKPGSITRTITVIEDLTTRMPGEYTQHFIWGGNWPSARERVVIALPAPLAARLQVTVLGADQPDTVRETLADGTTRLTWRRDNIPARRYEVQRAPSSQVGPAFRLSTIASWDDVGRWFSGLLVGREELSPSLASQVDTWTRGVEKREDLIRLLLAKASNDVRYTGLEFGQADYQPHSCNEVWENQYGDCKDKANLLAAFLRRKGVAAHVALVNTTHLGLIDRRAPDFRVFTHAIVAIPDGRGGYEFCDPTIESAEPGMIGPSSADRDVLVMKNGTAEWVRTPPQKAGRLDYRFDLKLSASGEISGWLNLTASGYYAAGQRARFRKADIHESRRRLGETVRGFFAGAEVIDVITGSIPPSESGPDTVKAYFVVQSQDGGETERRSLAFPRSDYLFLDLGTTSRRDSTYFLYQDDISVTTALALPPGFNAGALPTDYKVETPTGSAFAHWRFNAGVLTAEIHLNVSKSILPAGEFGRFYQGMQSLQAWLAKPAVLTADATLAASPEASLQVDLPLMPTGEGQLDLVEKRYPFSGNRALRRAALAKTVAYFPNDKPTVFTARLNLVILDWNEDKNQQALDQVVPLLATYRSDIPAESYAWGESVHGLVLSDLKRTDEALAIFTRMAADPLLSDERRALERLHAAHLLEPKSLDDAIAMLMPAALLDTSRQESANAQLSRLLLTRSRPDELRRHLGELVQRHPESAGELLTHVVKDSAQWTAIADRDLPAELAAIVRSLVTQPGDPLKAALDEAGRQQLLRNCSLEILALLKPRFAEPAFAALLPAVRDPALQTSEDFRQAIKAAGEKKDTTLAVQLALQSLVERPVGDDFPERLWLAANYANWHEAVLKKDVPILPLLLDLAERLPPADDAALDCRFLRAARLARKDDLPGERAIYQSILAVPGAAPAFKRAANGRLGRSLEKTADYSGALTAYRLIEPFAADYVDTADQLLRAVLINLHLDQPDEALRILDVLALTSEETLKKTTGEYNIRELLALSRTGRAKEFWAGRASWWPLWQEMERKLALPAPGIETIVPLIPEVSGLERELNQAERAKNPPLYWESFRRLQSAARWLPSAAAVSGDLYDQAARLAPDYSRELRKVVLAELEVPAPMSPPPDLRLRQLQLAINYHDGGLPAKALDVIAAFNAVPQSDDEAINRYMHRVWAFSARASKQQMPEAAAALAKDLANPDMTDNRSRAVGLLADLYKLNGQPEAEAALLTRELANPHIIADTQTHAALTERQDRLGGNARLAKQVGEWLRAYPLPWYDVAEPADLKDPRLRNLDAVLDNPSRIFNGPQVIKLQLLVAQSPSGSIERQREAFVGAFQSLLYASITHEEARQLAISVISEGHFDNELRTALLWQILVDTVFQDRPSDYRHWAAHPLAAGFNAEQKNWLASCTRFIELDKNSVAELNAYVADLTSREVSKNDVNGIQDVVTELIRLGDLDSTRTIIAGVEAWNLASDVSQTKESMQLDFSRQLRAAEAVHPVRDALRKQVIARLPELPSEPPAVYAARRHRTLVPIFSRPVTQDTLRYLLKTHRTSPTHLWFWHVFIDSLPATPENLDLACDLIKSALSAAPDDAVRADVIGIFCDALDNDVPEIRARVTALIEPYAQPVEAPLTTAQIRLREIKGALRLGQPVDLPAAFALVDDPELAQTRTGVMLRHYTQTRNLAMLKRTVDDLSSSQLLAPALLDDVIPALDLLGRKSDAALARGAAQRELKNTILEAWAYAAPHDIARALTLAEVLGGPSPFPPGWVESVCNRVTSPKVQGRVRMIDASLRGDWKTVAEAATALIRDYPAYYSYYWYQGVACSHLGDKPGAIAALTVYTRYSKEEIEYPKALALLKELTGKAGAP